MLVEVIGKDSLAVCADKLSEVVLGKGQFYTPAAVTRILAKVVGITTATRQDQTVYDPTCGSGSLLLKVAIMEELKRVTQQLAKRVKTLEVRYAEPLPQLMQEVEALSSKANEHLKQMGLVWSYLRFVDEEKRE